MASESKEARGFIILGIAALFQAAGKASGSLQAMMLCDANASLDHAEALVKEAEKRGHINFKDGK